MTVTEPKIKRIISLGLNYFGLHRFKLQYLADHRTDVVRLNFSHIDYDAAGQTMQALQQKFPQITAMQDLEGQRWSVAPEFPEKEKLVRAGEQVCFCAVDNYAALAPARPEEVLIPVKIEGSFAIFAKAQQVIMKDGAVRFRITDNQAEQGYLLATAENNIMLRPGKKLNIPGAARKSLPALTAKDKQDIQWGLAQGVQIICLSFVNKADDVREAKEFIGQHLSAGQPVPLIWANIETRSACDNFESILPEVDGVVLGREDLLSELDRFEILIIQCQLLHKFAEQKRAGQDFIIASNILDSMMGRFQTLPSIANLGSIYQSLIYGATGFMLTGEVGYGKRPKEVIKTFNDYLKFLEEKFNHD